MAKKTNEYSMGEALNAFLEIAELRQKAVIKRLETDWASFVGPTLAMQTRTLRFESGILYVYIDHPVWRHEFSFHHEQVREKINTEAGKEIVKEIRIFA